MDVRRLSYSCWCCAMLCRALRGEQVLPTGMVESYSYCLPNANVKWTVGSCRSPLQGTLASKFAHEARQVHPTLAFPGQHSHATPQRDLIVHGTHLQPICHFWKVTGCRVWPPRWLRRRRFRRCRHIHLRCRRLVEQPSTDR